MKMSNIRRMPNEFARKAVELRRLLDDDDRPILHRAMPDDWWEWRSENLPAIYDFATSARPEAIWRGFGSDKDQAERILYAAIQCLYEVSYMADYLAGMFERRFGFEERFRALHGAFQTALHGNLVNWPWLEPTPDLF